MNQLFVPSSEDNVPHRPQALWRFRRALDGSSHRLKAIRKLFCDNDFWGIKCILNDKKTIFLSADNIDPLFFVEVVEGRLPDDSAAYDVCKSTKDCGRPRLGFDHYRIISGLNRATVIWDSNMYTMFELNVPGYKRPEKPVPILDPTCLPFLPFNADFPTPTAHPQPHVSEYYGSTFAYSFPKKPQTSFGGKLYLSPIKFPATNTLDQSSICPPCTLKEYVANCVTCMDCEETFDLFSMTIFVAGEPGVVEDGKGIKFCSREYILHPFMDSGKRVNGATYKARFRVTTKFKEHSDCGIWKLFTQLNTERLMSVKLPMGSLQDFLVCAYGADACKPVHKRR